MRILTVTRRKSFVGCLAKIKLCVEVPVGEPYDVTINGKPCRIVGKLKNGETQSFEIGEHAYTLYAIADKLSAGYCRDIYPIDPGTENITLSGVCVFSPAAGNAFRFDGNASAEAVADRKKSKKIGIIVLIACVLIGGVLGYLSATMSSEEEPTAKDFYVDELVVTLDDSFENVDSEDPDLVLFASAYQNFSLTIELPPEGVDIGEYTEAELGEQLINSGHYSAGARLVKEDKTGLVYIEYENTQADAKYFMVIKKSETSIWLCHFGSTTDSFDEVSDRMLAFARTIRFAP